MARDIRSHRFAKVDALGEITLVREFRPYSDDETWGMIRFYSIYAGEVITELVVGEFEAESWDRFDETGTNQNLLQLHTLESLITQTKERIKTLADLISE